MSPSVFTTDMARGNEKGRAVYQQQNASAQNNLLHCHAHFLNKAHPIAIPHVKFRIQEGMQKYKPTYNRPVRSKAGVNSCNVCSATQL